MIISASRRTDIPAFYSKWFMNRIRDKFALVRNPLFTNRILKVSLNPADVDAIVFWTKNPQPMIKHITELNNLGYFYYFLFTLNPYYKTFEPNIPEQSDLIDSFHQLSSLLGNRRLIWRYDPIIITDNLDEKYHLDNFYKLASSLQGLTKTCITSFMVAYKKCIKNMCGIKVENIDAARKARILNSLKSIADHFDIQLQICADEDNLECIEFSSCVDIKLINELTGKNIKYKKDAGQRENCHCAGSIDIGSYNTCQHGCIYCYANYDTVKVVDTIALHDPDSPLLIGEVGENSKIMEAKNLNHKVSQSTR
jgi:hypothetical protein